MEFEDCVKFAKENPITYIATVEKNQPRVRAFGMWFADSTGFYYQTSTYKNIVEQIKENPKIELCFTKPGAGGGTQMRVTGEVEFLNDASLKKKVMQDRPFLPKVGVPSAESPTLVIFRVAKGEAHFWTMATNLEPKQVIKFG